MANWNDGGLPFGSRTVKFYTAGASDASGNTQWTSAKEVYILESFAPSRPQRVSKRYDEAGKPNGAVAQDDFVEGSATVQLANVTTVPINTGDAFTSVRRGTGGTAESFVCISADEPEDQNGIRKQSIRLQKIVAAPSGNLPVVYP